MRNPRVGTLVLRGFMDNGVDENGLRHLAPARIHPKFLHQSFMVLFDLIAVLLHGTLCAVAPI